MIRIARVVFGEIAKGAAQFGLFGPHAAAARTASPGGAWGGGAPASGTHTEERTDKTGRTEKRTVRDEGPAQLGLLGGATPLGQAPKSASSQRPRLALNPSCMRCGGLMPRHDEHARGTTCGACARTVDWIAAADHRTFAGLHG